MLLGSSSSKAHLTCQAWCGWLTGLAGLLDVDVGVPLTRLILVEFAPSASGMVGCLACHSPGAALAAPKHSAVIEEARVKRINSTWPEVSLITKYQAFPATTSNNDVVSNADSAVMLAVVHNTVQPGADVAMLLRREAAVYLFHSSKGRAQALLAACHSNSASLASGNSRRKFVPSVSSQKSPVSDTQVPLW